LLLFKRPFRSAYEMHAERLECYRRTWHQELGVAAALYYCDKYDVDLPRWVLRAAPVVLGQALSKSLSKKRGRSSNPIARYRQDMIDFTRWDAVRDTRTQQINLRQGVAELRKIRGAPPAMLRERERMMNWAGRTWLRAYECATMILAHTEARGSPDAMKGSYIRVEANKHPLRYHQFDSNFLRAVGLDVNFEARQRPKIIPFFEPTL
jgi:hypothetical protein